MDMKKRVVSLAIAAALLAVAGTAAANSLFGSGQVQTGSGVSTSGMQWLLKNRLAPGPATKQALARLMYMPNAQGGTPPDTCARYSVLESLEPSVRGGDPLLYADADPLVPMHREGGAAVWMPEMAVDGFPGTRITDPIDQLIFFGGIAGAYHMPDIIFSKAPSGAIKSALVTVLVGSSGAPILNPQAYSFNGELFNTFRINPNQISDPMNYITETNVAGIENSIEANQSINAHGGALGGGASYMPLSDFLKTVSNLRAAQWAPVAGEMNVYPTRYVPPIGTYNRFSQASCNYGSSRLPVTCQQIAAPGQRIVKLPWMNKKDVGQVEFGLKKLHPTVIMACQYTGPVKDVTAPSEYWYTRNLSPFWIKPVNLGPGMAYDINPKIVQKTIFGARSTAPAAISEYVVGKQVENILITPLASHKHIDKWLLAVVPTSNVPGK
jgi:hypothetical protein